MNQQPKRSAALARTEVSWLASSSCVATSRSFPITTRPGFASAPLLAGRNCPKTTPPLAGDAECQPSFTEPAGEQVGIAGRGQPGVDAQSMTGNQIRDNR